MIEVNTGVDRAQQADISVFPNPATGETTLINPDGRPLTLELHDMRGRMVRSLSASGARIGIHLEGLDAGQYLLRATGLTGVSTLRLQVTDER